MLISNVIGVIGELARAPCGSLLLACIGRSSSNGYWPFEICWLLIRLAACVRSVDEYVYLVVIVVVLYLSV